MSNSQRRTGILLASLVVFSAFLTIVGCSKNDVMAPDDGLYSSLDDAEAIANNIAEEPGGAIDQMSFLSDLAGEDGIENVAAAAAEKIAASTAEVITSVDTSYDEGAGLWTISISYERSNPTRGVSAGFTREYTVQFLKNGVAQKYFVNGSDTATTISMVIAEGTGEYHSNRLRHHLVDISGNWTAQNVNGAAMTVNGTYNRAASDTLLTRNATRTFNYSLSLQFAGISIPTGDGDDISQFIAGGMSGNYEAEISITRGGETYEQSVSRPFAVAFAFERFTLDIDGSTFTVDAETGELE